VAPSSRRSLAARVIDMDRYVIDQIVVSPRTSKGAERYECGKTRCSRTRVPQPAAPTW
jgi:hypothetical protein